MTSQKKLKKYGIPASILVGGVALGSMLAPIGLANAQEGDDVTDEGPSTDRGPGRHGERGALMEELLGLDRDELKAAFEEGKTLAEIAVEQGVTEDELVAAIVAETTERIEQAVENGRIDDEDAAEKLEDLQANVTERVNSEPGEFGHGHRAHHRTGRFGAGEVLEGLGLDQDTLRAGFEEGKTLAEIADEAGVDESDLVTALVTEAEERIDQAVQNGRIDAEKAAELKADLEEKITERVNADPSERRGHHGRAGDSGPEGETEETGTV